MEGGLKMEDKTGREREEWREGENTARDNLKG